MSKEAVGCSHMGNCKVCGKEWCVLFEGLTLFYLSRGIRRITIDTNKDILWPNQFWTHYLWYIMWQCLKFIDLVIWRLLEYPRVIHLLGNRNTNPPPAIGIEALIRSSLDEWSTTVQCKETFHRSLCLNSLLVTKILHCNKGLSSWWQRL